MKWQQRAVRFVCISCNSGSWGAGYLVCACKMAKRSYFHLIFQYWVIAQGMYHPQYFGRTAIKTIEVRE